jgi:stage III sporulation protein SpoIIIAA
MLDTLRLKFGHAAESPPEVIKATPVTVFVGPNNSGKSKVLTEIERYCRSGQKSANTVILDEVTFTGIAAEAKLRAVDRLIVAPQPADHCPPGQVLMENARGSERHLTAST